MNKLNSLPIPDKEVAQEILKMRVNINDNKIETEKLDKQDLPKWFETKYVAGGQRDIEFLKFFYENKSSFIDQHEKDKKQLLFKRLENVFFKLEIFSIKILNSKLPGQIFLQIHKKKNKF